MKRRRLALPLLLRVGRALSAGLLLAATALPSLAATTSELRGVVMDGNHKPLAGVTLVLRNDGLACPEQGRVTDAGGRYRFQLLPPGRGYRLRASLPGYATVEFWDIVLEVGGAHTQDIVLRPESEARETIRVQAKADLIDTESPATSTLFSSDFAAGLPLLGREYQEILSLAPGVTDVNSTGNPNIHGARDTDMVTLVDGVSSTDPFTGRYGQDLNIESIQEIEVITSGATADFSRAQGGFANILTKSGGNEFQGTFKLFVRTSRLDGDGAGIDPPDLQGGIAEAEGYRELDWTDLYPFLSLSGPVVRDRLWWYLASEYILQETPVNALTQAFVIPTRGYREFLKTTWQIAPTQKLVFSINVDRTVEENLGIDSLTRVESGYTFKRGGPTYSLREDAVFGPDRLLESTVSWFDNNFAITPTLDPDTNGNGVLTVDGNPALGGNQDGILQIRELDSGEDFDRDGVYDLWEDLNEDGIIDTTEDVDGDGRLTPRMGCEGGEHEDLNCNGQLDREVDLDLDGVADPDEDTGIPLPCLPPGLPCDLTTVPGTAANGKFDSEDRNGNGVLDVFGDSGATPFPFWEDRNGNGTPDPGEFQSPLAPDRGFVGESDGRVSGPYPYQYSDHRTRLTWREDLSLFVPDLLGSHDMKLGAVFEREGFDRDTLRMPIVRKYPYTTGEREELRYGRLVAFMSVPTSVNNTAESNNLGLFLQDTYKPIPNLTLGLGLRFDSENVTSFGYTPFDPREERRAYNEVMSVAGQDPDPSDGVNTMGICSDPLYGCGGSTVGSRLGQILNELKTIAPRRLTRHNADLEILSAFFQGAPGELVTGGFNLRLPEEIRIENRNLAPRLSATWDPWADGKSKVFASWNRYYDKLFLNTMVLEEGPDQFVRAYVLDLDGVDERGHPNAQAGKPISQSPATAFQIDRGLRTPYCNEFTAGFQRELAPELSVAARYVRRDYRDQLQDIDLNHRTARDAVTGRFLDRVGLIDCGRSWTGYIVCESRPDEIPDLFVENFFVNRVLRLGNYNTQTYRGWELELTRRLSRKWQMEANYTHSESRGDAESFLSEAGDDPSLAEFEPGYLDYDQRHVVKVSATAYLPRDWLIGGIAKWASGLPYSMVQLRTSADDAGYVQERLLYGRIGESGFAAETRNSHRNQAAYDFSARVQKNFVLGRATASAFFEVFNLLNSDSLRVYYMAQTLPSENSLGEMNNVGERRFGRRFQFGFQIDF